MVQHRVLAHPDPDAVGDGQVQLAQARGVEVRNGAVHGRLLFLAYLCYLEFGRGYDWGYGPRYQMVLLVPMAVGCGVAIAPLAIAARARTSGGRWALARGGPLALVLFAAVSAWLRVIALGWPMVAEHTHAHSAIQRAVEHAELTHAIVIAADGTTSFAPEDLPTNLPLDLYPDQDVIIAIDHDRPSEARACLRGAFPDRRIFIASGYDEVSLKPAN